MNKFEMLNNLIKSTEETKKAAEMLAKEFAELNAQEAEQKLIQNIYNAGNKFVITPESLSQSIMKAGEAAKEIADNMKVKKLNELITLGMSICSGWSDLASQANFAQCYYEVTNENSTKDQKYINTIKELAQAKDTVDSKHIFELLNVIESQNETIEQLAWDNDVYEKAVVLFSEFIRNKDLQVDFQEFYIPQLDEQKQLDNEVHELIDTNIYV